MFVECCNKLRSCKTYSLEPLEGFVFCIAHYLEKCPVCGHSVLLIKRYDPEFKPHKVRKTNEKARQLLDKIKPYILCEYRPNKAFGSSAFALRYNHFGTIKKSYSNLSSLKIGLFDPPGRDLPVMPEYIELRQS